MLIGGASGASPTLIIGVGGDLSKSTLEERSFSSDICQTCQEAPSIIKCF